MMKFQVYFIRENNNFSCNISSDIEVDLIYWHHKNISKIFAINEEFTIGRAKELAAILQMDISYVDSFLVENMLVVEELTVKEGYNELLLEYQLWKEYNFTPLEGRLLLLEELMNLISKFEELNNLSFNFNRVIQMGYLLKEIKIDSGVSFPYNISKKKILKTNICNRCGSKIDIIIQSCSLCEDYCATCENCIVQGRSKSCIPLFYFHQEIASFSTNKAIPLLPYTAIKYSQAQLDIANKLVQFINNEHSKEFLVWAVTGAGKTEMTFPAIKLALELGQKVLFTAPRKDVIKDLLTRFKDAFPDVQIVSLYAESEEKWLEGSLYLATVQQTLRFSNYFDLVIIDELDAYPYQNSRQLQYYVSRAAKTTAKTILMTATPPKEWSNNLKKRAIDFVVLSQRFHGKPLPAPQIKFIPKSVELLKRTTPITLFSKFFDEVNKVNGRGLIFVPRVKDVETWTEKLGLWFSGEIIAGIHANDQKRSEKIEMFKTNAINFLVTTTILERGVTFSNLHVLIVNAEDNIYDEASLIQIAGRVGRSAEYPSGIVWFLAEYMTKDMAGSLKQINKMNRHAKKNKKHDNVSVL